METVNGNRNPSESPWDSLRAPAEAKSPKSIEDVLARVIKIGNASVRVADVQKANKRENVGDADEIKANGYNSSEKKVFTPGEVAGYFDDQFRANHEALDRFHTDPAIRQTYDELMSEFPQLRSIAIDNYNEQNAFSANACPVSTPNGTKMKRLIKFNFRNPDIYLSSRFNEKGDLKGFYTVLTEIALRTGAKPEDISKNRALVASFILAHEFGHAMDFDNNYLQPSIRKARQLYPYRRDVTDIALTEAQSKSREARARDMTAVLDGSIDFETSSLRKDILASRLEDLDLKTATERNVAHNKSYRTTHSETFADDFAMHYIMRHYDRFFYDSKSGEKKKGRVETNTHGETRKIGDELVPFLDFHAGKHVSLVATTTFGKPKQEKLDCYLMDSLRNNSELKVGMTGDPVLKNAQVRSLGNITDVRIKQEKINGRIKNTFFLLIDDAARTVIKMEVSGNGEAPEIDVDPSDFLKRYHIGEGSLMTLLKRQVGNGKASAVGTGQIMSGRLKRNNYGGLIDIGDGLYLGATNKPGFTGGNTSTIRRCYRKWKRYYIETSTSTYELLPYIEGKQ
ncbi:MAG: hypothetical protein MJ154_03120 [Candidatus Saccharibacteria bacterium]|nr:hypothetical protein [Candidatus Saccharibacteria bacterium]